MGVVYQARQRQLKRLVALKMILSGAPAHSGYTTRFQAEAEAVARLQHPHIVQVHEVGAVGDQPFFSLEFIDGGSLEQKLVGAPLPGRTAARLLETLARAIHFAHEHGIVHRDLKPANILLSGGAATPLDRCTPKVADFGLAKKLDDDAGQTQSGAVMGTPSYSFSVPQGSSLTLPAA
jgi:serine/threonine-protein kinase